MIIAVAHDGALTGAENMRRDMQLIDRIRSGAVDVDVRTYQWTPWCVSLGAHQSPSQVDVVACHRRGVDIVTRPTGGRAVLHAQELTYAFAVRVPEHRSARDVYQAFHTLLHRALVTIAPALELSTTAPSLREHYAASGPLGQVCFSSHAPSELLWDGRKVVGSAQRVIDGIVLQHGSILCGPGHEQLGQVLAVDPDMRARIVETTTASSATLTDVAGHHIEPSDVDNVLRVHLTQQNLSSLLFTE